MPTIFFHCPWHGVAESIELPDGDFNFKGEIKCGSAGPATGPGGQPQNGPFTLSIELSGGSVVKVSRALGG